MFRKLVVLTSLLVLAGSAKADNWSENSSAYYGRGQQLSTWQNGGHERVFLADSTLRLYYRLPDDTVWFTFTDSTVKNARGVIGINGYDTLLISRWGYNLDEDEWGVYRCDDPTNEDADFDEVAPNGPGTMLQNENVIGFVRNTGSDTVLYALGGYKCKGYSKPHGYPTQRVGLSCTGSHVHMQWNVTVCAQLPRIYPRQFSHRGYRRVNN